MSAKSTIKVTEAPSEDTAGMALKASVAKETAVVSAERRIEARAWGEPSSVWAKCA
jgi:hypothetical protein